MAISLSQIKTGKETNPPRILLYGVRGIGKSTFGAAAWSPIFIMAEEGLGKIVVPHFDQARKYQDVIDQIDALLLERHEYRTCVIDTVDALEQLIFTHVSKKAGKDSIEEFGYGKGYAIAQTEWLRLLEKLDKLRDEKRMAILLLGHSLIKAYNAPDTESYDRFRPDLHDKSASSICDWVDAILFANYRVYTREATSGKERHIAEGSGERVMYTQERPAYWAKNRYSLPPEMAFDFATFAKCLLGESNGNGQSGQPPKLRAGRASKDDRHIENNNVETDQEGSGSEGPTSGQESASAQV